MTLLNLPNKLTLSRIIAVPVIVGLLQFNSPTLCLIAFTLFVMAAITDLLDGWLARRDNQVTSLGKFLDPLADKILVCGVLIIFVELGWVSSWIAILIIFRDIMVTGLRAIAADEGIVIAADKYGKLKTIIQMLALGPLIIHYPLYNIPVEIIGQVLLYIAVLLTLFSGCNYFVNFFKLWRKDALYQDK